ncbi:MAG: ABC transporter ATP-binding protein [Pseudomonadota bacterium]
MGEPLLRTEGLTVVFGGLRALDGLDLTVREGEIIGLIGPNGAGKTTAFNAITGFIKPAGGRVIFRGRSITGNPPWMIAQSGIARTFQNIRLYADLTVLENVMVAGHCSISYSFVEAILGVGRLKRDEKAVRAKGEHLLEFMGLADVAREKASSLPYGSRRKLEVARALALDPGLLLLDEPVAGMNPMETIDFGELVGKLRMNSSLSILLIDHDMRFVMDVCERIRVLEYGMPIAWGTPSEIQNNERVIEAYLGQEH